MTTEVMQVDENIGAFKRKKDLASDFTAETKKAVLEAQGLVGENKIDLAIEKLLQVEKKARLAEDFTNVQTCCLVILKIFQQKNMWEDVNKYLVLLCKRRSQAESVITAIITYGADSLVPAVASDQQKEALIDTLREISEGKLAVESVRAGLTMTLSQMKEKQGDVVTACKLLNEETPETYTSMERRRKAFYLLEQVRLCLATKDWIRAQLLLKKIDHDALEQHEDLKLSFYKLKIEYCEEHEEAFDAALAHLSLANSESIKNDDQKWPEELKAAVINLACSKSTQEQKMEIHNLLKDLRLKQLGDWKDFLAHFVTDEVVQWPLPEEKTISVHPLLEKKTWRHKVLFDRVIQHDLQVISLYYSRLYIDNLAEMLNLTSDGVEKYISGMVSERDLFVKIDRPEGTVEFQKTKTAEENLTDWTDKIGELVGLVDKTCHLIHKENMLHEAKKTAELSK